jgi:tyrosyl-tRNA synthetase
VWHLKIEEIKPILRPLSSMTEEHKKFYGGRKEFDALEFAYLLKQGYDFFELIESGQAIDATKQKSSV